MPVINRVISGINLSRFLNDYKNLIKILNNSKGELDISIREDYLNIYFKGNSLAKIKFKEKDGYTVIIHEKFFEDTNADDPKFYEGKNCKNNYISLTLSAKKPPLRLLQKKHIDQFCSKIKKVNYGEEIVFEQALITDNMKRHDLIIIDRQITDKKLKRRRMDLLALEQIKSGFNKYNFLVIEVKLGNNPELKNDVAKQLNDYITHIENHFNDYKMCYEQQFSQKKELKIIKNCSFNTISIEKPVKGKIVVGGYSKIAEGSISELRKNFPNLQVKQFNYKL